MQKLTQTQQQQQVQQQRLSQQQMLQVKLLEMPLTELEQNINAELDDNPALEEQRDDPDMMRIFTKRKQSARNVKRRLTTPLKA